MEGLRVFPPNSPLLPSIEGLRVSPPNSPLLPSTMEGLRVSPPNSPVLSSTMEELRVGFLGSGNMCQAVAGGLIASGTVPASNITCSARSEGGLAAAKAMGMNTTLDNGEVARSSTVVFLAVKPHILPGVLKEVAEFVTEDHLLLCVAGINRIRKYWSLIG
eukprot:sb/3472802/